MIANSCLLGDLKRPTGRVSQFIHASTLMYSLSWVLYSCGHFVGGSFVIFADHEAGNCAGFALNTAGLVGIVGGNSFVLMSAIHTLLLHQTISWRRERIFYIIGIGLVVLAGLTVGLLCRFRCGSCSVGACNAGCQDLWLVTSYSWVASLMIPLLLALAFAVTGWWIQRDRSKHRGSLPAGQRAPPHDRTFGTAEVVAHGIPVEWRSATQVNDSARTYHFGEDLYVNLWRELKWYPATLLFLALIYVASNVAAKETVLKNPARSDFSDVNKTSLWAIVGQTCWALMAAQGVLHLAMHRKNFWERLRQSLEKCKGKRSESEGERAGLLAGDVDDDAGKLSTFIIAQGDRDSGRPFHEGGADDAPNLGGASGDSVPSLADDVDGLWDDVIVERG